MKAPPPLIAIASKEVQVFLPTSGLAATLGYMRRNDFFQIIVDLDGSLRVLTTEGGARRSERRADEGVVNVAAAILQYALEHEELTNAVYAGRAQTIHDGRAFFA